MSGFARAPQGLKVALVAIAVGIVILFLFGASPRPAPEPAIGPGPADDLSDGRDEIAVDLRDGTSDQELAAFGKKHHVELSWVSSEPGIVRAALALGHVPVDRQPSVLAELRQDPLVETAEHNGLLSIPDLGAFDESASRPLDQIPEEEAGKPREGFPNDALFDKQWNMRMIHAPEAWNSATGDGVIVGVIDTGVAYENKRGILIPDLEKTRFVEGYDFIHNDRIPADDNGHGSHCAGTIAQSTDNGRGCVGVAPKARIMPLKVLTGDGWGSDVNVAAAIRYGADHGCKVLSLSLGGGGYSKILKDSVWYAYSKGVVVACAAGNGGRAKVEYPAAYPGAIAVSSVGPRGKRAFYSSYGDQVWISAPGGDKSAGPQDGVLQNTINPARKTSFYGFWQGTSMATPHVAAVSALLVECGVTSPKAVMGILAATAKKPDGSGGEKWDRELGWGTIDAEAAVRRALAPDRLSLVLAVFFVGGLVLLTRAKEVGRGEAFVGALFGASGLFFLREVGLGELPLAGVWGRAVADWAPGNPLLASALVPATLGFVTQGSRLGRSLSLGLAAGTAAHLLAMAVYRYTDLALVPEAFGLDRVWLVANAAALGITCAMVVRLARTKGAAA